MAADETDPPLQSWKRIAAYLARSERTVRRWEAKEGLPVHRHQHDGGATVYAIPAELDRWLAARAAPAQGRPPEARAAFERGMFLRGQHNPQALMKAAEEFTLAGALDPAFAEAFARKAEVLPLASLLGVAPPHAVMPAALDAVAKALSIDGEEAACHASLGLILSTYSYDWQGAEAAFARAEKLDPDLSGTYQWRAELFAAIGRQEEAERDIERGLFLEPASLTIAVSKGLVLMLGGRNEEAIALMEDVLSRDRHYPVAHIQKTASLLEMERYEEALAAAMTGTQAIGPMPDLEALRGFAAARLGDHETAAAVGRTIEAMFGPQGGAFQKGALALGRGDWDEAAAHFEASVDARGWQNLMLGRAQVFTPLHDKPRFRAVLRKMGFPGWG